MIYSPGLTKGSEKDFKRKIGSAIAIISLATPALIVSIVQYCLSPSLLTIASGVFPASVALYQFADALCIKKRNRRYSERVNAYSGFLDERNRLILNGFEPCFVATMQCYLGYILKCMRTDTRNSVSFELSIFTNVQYPEIIVYWDTSGQSTPSSAKEREKNPNYYREQGYDAVKLLDAKIVSHEPFVRPKAIEPEFCFTGPEQKKRVRSNLCYCFDSDGPYVLAISANKKRVFNKNNAMLNSFLYDVGRMMRAEILMNGNG